MKTKIVSISHLACVLPVMVAGVNGIQAAETVNSTNSVTKASATATSAKLVPFADFESGKPVTLAGVPWETFTDSSLGGKSSIDLSMVTAGAQKSKGAIQLKGKLTADFQWGGFVGARAWVLAGGAPKDLSGFSGVQFYARGDEKKYQLLIARESVKDSNHFGAEFTAPSEWTLVRIPFSKLAQSPYFGTAIGWSATDITGVGFLARAEPGASTETRLEIDDVQFYSED